MLQVWRKTQMPHGTLSTKKLQTALSTSRMNTDATEVLFLLSPFLGNFQIDTDSETNQKRFLFEEFLYSMA